MRTEYRELRSEIQAVLTPELLKPEYRHDRNDLNGHCYAASEAFFHMAGGREVGLRPHMNRNVDGTSHWWLEDADGSAIDLTEELGDRVGHYDYAAGGPRGFRTKDASKRARLIISRVEARRAGTYTGPVWQRASVERSVVRRLRRLFAR